MPEIKPIILIYDFIFSIYSIKLLTISRIKYSNRKEIIERIERVMIDFQGLSSEMICSGFIRFFGSKDNIFLRT